MYLLLASNADTARTEKRERKRRSWAKIEPLGEATVPKPGKKAIVRASLANSVYAKVLKKEPPTQKPRINISQTRSNTTKKRTAPRGGRNSIKATINNTYSYNDTWTGQPAHEWLAFATYGAVARYPNYSHVKQTISRQVMICTIWVLTCRFDTFCRICTE